MAGGAEGAFWRDRGRVGMRGKAVLVGFVVGGGGAEGVGFGWGLEFRETLADVRVVRFTTAVWGCRGGTLRFVVSLITLS